MKENLILSIIICVYKSPFFLTEKALKSLEKQSLDKNSYEVIIVDNNSDQLTKKIISSFEIRLENFKVIKEEKQGLSNSRNRGIMSANGDIIAFIDDDAFAHPNWAEKIIKAFKNNSKAIVVGGVIIPWYTDNNFPLWYSDTLHLRSWGNKKGYLVGKSAASGFSGSNIAFKKRVFEEYGIFNENLGMKGNELLLGEETELCKRIFKKEPYFWYDPSIIVYHFVPKDKITVKYFIKRNFKGGINYFSVNSNDFNIKFLFKRLFRITLYFCKLVFYGVLYFIPSKSIKEYFMFNFFKFVMNIGAILSFLIYSKRKLLYKLGKPKENCNGNLYECKKERFGSIYGGWYVCTEMINNKSVVYSFGIGEDISFDLELIKKYELTVHAFDPTPKSVKWIKSKSLPNNFIMHEIGISDYDGFAFFAPPQNADFVSYKIIKRRNVNTIKLPVYQLSSIMKMLGHNRIDILKLDIEGEEYAVIKNLKESNIRPQQILIEFHQRFNPLAINKTKKALKKMIDMGYVLFYVSPFGEEYSFIYKK